MTPDYSFIRSATDKNLSWMLTDAIGNEMAKKGEGKSLFF